MNDIKNWYNSLSKSQGKSFSCRRKSKRPCSKDCIHSVLEIYIEAHSGTRDAVTHKSSVQDSLVWWHEPMNCIGGNKDF